MATVPNFCAGEQTVTVASTFLGSIANTVNTTNGGTYFDTYTGWSRAQSGREGLIKLVLPVTRDVTISDTHASLDLHLVQLTGGGCDGNPVTYTALVHTESVAATAQNVPAGTYYVIVDGYNGAVGATTVIIGISGP